ncbi:hypothetical protein FDECE_11299 [Fusarium decemcellulare]|nr:hypothetical protein FDECE_11299 [Fusarium decemcellulare]
MEPTRPPRDRAHVVCVDCHARKVKCDLQDKPDGPCANCSRLGRPCIRRDGVRKKRKLAKRRQIQPADLPSSGSVPDTGLATPSRHVSVPSVASVGAISSESRQPKGFISPTVVLHYDVSAEEPENTRPCTQAFGVRDSILSVTEADVLPRSALLQALTESYFRHVHPFYPIVDEGDLRGPEVSVMLQQAVGLAGSLMQHDPEMVPFCRSQYEKVKTLLYLNHEHDNVTVLKTMCLLTCYSPLPSDQVTLDGPWHWSGVAMRLAVQMGLHKNATYRQHANSVCLRRIFWQLVNADRLTSACWGRPSAFLHLQGCDVPALTEDDFPTQGRCSKMFIETLKLSKMLETLTETNLRQSGISTHDAAELVRSLCDWLHHLPEDLRLYGPDDMRRPFWRPAVDLNICVSFPWRITPASFVAASCIARLYEEIHYREQTAHLLHIHGFFCMVAAVPLICYPRGSPESNASREQDIGIICAVLGRLRHRYGGVRLVLKKILGLQEQVRRDHRFTVDNQASNTGQHSMPASSSIQSRISELFAFPRSFCGALDLLNYNKDHPLSSNELLGLKMMQEFFGEELFSALRSSSVSHSRDMMLWIRKTDRFWQRDDLSSEVGGQYLAEVCFSSYARPGLTFKDRSLMNMAMLIALNRGPELRIHIRAALKNGFTEEQICEVCRHAMIYCGVPAGRDALVIAGEILEEEKKRAKKAEGPKLS